MGGVVSLFRLHVFKVWAGIICLYLVFLQQTLPPNITEISQALPDVKRAQGRGTNTAVTIHEVLTTHEFGTKISHSVTLFCSRIPTFRKHVFMKRIDVVRNGVQRLSESPCLALCWKERVPYIKHFRQHT